MVLRNENLRKCKPFLKWAGGKKWLAPLVPTISPTNFKTTYYEPFMGAGSFFFSINPTKAVLSDLNKDLIDTYNAIKTDVNLVINLLQKYPYEKDFYYYMRSKKPRSLHGSAARFIYLNRTCWNGLYRVNRKGQFNVPFGTYENPMICDASLLRQVSKRLENVNFKCCDFSKAVSKAKKGALVYFDPPYITGHRNNGFHMYNNRLFSWEDQERLSTVSEKLRLRKVNVLISNADHPNIHSLYPNFHHYMVKRKSLIGGNGSKRGEITETLISSYPLKKLKAEVI